LCWNCGPANYGISLKRHDEADTHASIIATTGRSRG